MDNLRTLEAIVLASQLGFVFAAAVAIGLFAGAYLDTVTNLSPLFVMVGALLGTAAGIYSCVQIVQYMQKRRRSR